MGFGAKMCQEFWVNVVIPRCSSRLYQLQSVVYLRCRERRWGAVFRRVSQKLPSLVSGSELKLLVSRSFSDLDEVGGHRIGPDGRVVFLGRVLGCAKVVDEGPALCCRSLHSINTYGVCCSGCGIPEARHWYCPVQGVEYLKLGVDIVLFRQWNAWS